jgi:hypothetical protein
MVSTLAFDAAAAAAAAHIIFGALTETALLRCPTARYFTFGAAIAILSLGLPARPDTSLVRWADRQAADRAAEA